LSTEVSPLDFRFEQKKKLVVKAVEYQLIAGNLYKLGTNGILQCRVLEHEISMILSEAHEGVEGGHYAGKETAHKIFCVGLWWPTLHKDAKELCQTCDVYHRVGKPSRIDEMPLVL
jgi:hypothetical protein